MKLSKMNENDLREMVTKLLVVIKTEKLLNTMLNDSSNKYLEGMVRSYEKTIDLIENDEQLDHMYKVCLPYYNDYIGGK